MNTHTHTHIFLSSLDDMFLLILERGRGGERGREREISVRVRKIGRLPPVRALPGDQTCSLGLCPNQELNPQPFGVWGAAPTNGAAWPGQ